MSAQRVSISAIGGTSLYHALLGEKTMRVRLTATKDGGLRLSRFHPRRNLKVREVVLNEQETVHYNNKSADDRVRFLFARLS